MQICYRCEEKTNELLEKMAKKNGVSKNHLIDEIIKEYLGYGIKNNQSFHLSHTESKLLPAIQYANELLAQLLEELNNIFIYASSNPATNVNKIIGNNVDTCTNNHADSPENRLINIGMPENTENTDEFTAANISTQHLSFPTFYTQAVYLLLEVSKTLEMIRKKENI